MSLGEVDTLNLLTDKLNNLFDESQGYYESFLDTNNRYKEGKLTEREFFQKLGDYVVAYSALEFLSIKVIFEIKKAVDKISGGASLGGTQSPGLMPGMGTPGMMPGGMATPPGPRSGTAENPVGGPASVISTATSFDNAGTLPTPDPSLVSKPSNTAKCSSCGSDLRQNAKFCTNCGNKI